MSVQKIAQQMIQRALAAIDPFRLIEKKVKIEADRFVLPGLELSLNKFNNIIVIGFGKAAAPMAAAIEAKLGDRIARGAVVTKYGYGQPLQQISLFEAGHPLPDENSLKATQKILSLCQNLSENDLVIVLISGGGSALFEQLPEQISLSELQQFNQLLLQSGATIEEINALRKHISRVKGGKLAKLLAPATIVNIILSDVIGDPLQSIASGPTVPDPTTSDEIKAILNKYGLEQKLPDNIRNLLIEVDDHVEIETAKPDPKIFKNVYHIILGNNQLALEQLAEVAKINGFNPLILTDRLQGEAREAAKLIAAIIESSIKRGMPLKSPGCLILGGEPTVTINGSGRGGRNQEMVLAVMLALKKVDDPFYFCSLGTDGTDGPTDAAGAWIDQNSWFKARKLGLSPQHFLEDNDSYHFFKATNQLLITGPTGTNVMDMMFCLF